MKFEADTVVPSAETLDEILARDDVDGMMLTVPNEQHYPVALQVAKADKHVYTEKPIAHNLEDGLAIVTLHVPLQDGTRGLIGAAEIGLMKPGAILVNAARGGIVDEAALAEALEAGRIGGAVVDVYSTEPPAPDNPLLTLSAVAAQRLILTPHIAGVTRQAWASLFAEAWNNVARVLLQGEPACHVTNGVAA